MHKKTSFYIRIVCLSIVALALFITNSTSQSDTAYAATSQKTHAINSEARHIVIWYYANSGYRARVGTRTYNCDGSIVTTGTVTQFAAEIVDDPCEPSDPGYPPS